MSESGMSFDDGIGATLTTSIGPGAHAQEAFLDYAIEIQTHAQDNAPWLDRTGAARAGLDVDVYENDGEVVLELFHTVDYGQWLETIQSGRFATIMPTLELYAQEVFDAAGARVQSDFGGTG